MPNNPAVEELINQLKPYLRQYLEMQGVRPDAKGQFNCFNPGAHNHGDKKASAHIIPNGQGYKCYGCEIKGNIFTACNHFEGRVIEGKEFIDTLKHLADMFHIQHGLDEQKAKKKSPAQKYVKETEYIYTDINNSPIYKIVRMVNPENKKDKQFYPYMYDSLKGDYDKTSKFSEDCKRELYRLVEVNKAIEAEDYIFFVEGEKCVEILRGLDLTATCVSGGAMAWKKPHSNRYVTSLCNAKVVVLPDNDSAGRKFANHVAKDITATANVVKVLELDGLPPKGDIEQWIRLDESHTKEKLLELCENAKSFSTEKEIDRTRSVYIQDNKYYRVGKEFDKAISNFIIVPHECVEEDNTQYFFATAVTDGNNSEVRKINTISIKFSTEAFINKSVFKKIFQSAYLSFTGNDDDLQTIKLLIAAGDYDYKKGVKHIGLHKVNDKYIFVGNDKSLTDNNTEDTSTVLMPKYETITTSILDNDIISPDEVSGIIKNLFNFNTLDKMATIMGFISACYFKAHFIECRIEFPHLLMFGPAGSGKTQTVKQIIKPFFGVPGEQDYGAKQLTKFTAMKLGSSSNAIPFIIEEYKPADVADRVKNIISDLLRNAYNNSSGVRGTADQGITTYSLINPIIMVGEEAINEPAILERSLELSYGKIDLTDDAKYNHRQVVEKNDSVKRLGRSVLLQALKTNPETVMELYREAERHVSGNKDIQTRIINNICVVFTGLELLDNTLQQYGWSIEDCTGYSIETLRNAIVSAVQENILSESGTSLSTVDRTIAIFDRMVSHGKLIKGIHYTFITLKAKGMEGREVLALDINLIYDLFTKYVKEHAVQSEILLSSDNFIKQLMKMEYFIPYIQVNKDGKEKKLSTHPTKFKQIIDGTNKEIQKRVYRLDLEVLREKVPLQNFYSGIYESVEDYNNDWNP